MDGAVWGALITALVGGPIVYLLGTRKLRYERLYEKRAEVIAELARLLSGVQNTARLATIPGVPLEVRKQRIRENRKMLTELVNYFHGHTPWLEAPLVQTIYDFTSGLSQALKHYEAELNKGTPDSALAVRAAEHVQRILPEAEKVLEVEFRAILYPTPWHVWLLQSLVYILDLPKRRRDQP